jgi:hypothetical protein
MMVAVCPELNWVPEERKGNLQPTAGDFQNEIMIPFAGGQIIQTEWFY